MLRLALTIVNFQSHLVEAIVANPTTYLDTLFARKYLQSFNKDCLLRFFVNIYFLAILLLWLAQDSTNRHMHIKFIRTKIPF